MGGTEGGPGMPGIGTVPACRAPFVAMEFDAFGDVQACCANTLYPLGNVGRSSLRDIWEGPRATLLRDAVRRGDLSFGCTICRHRLAFGHGDLALEFYDAFPLPDGEADWPHFLQFSLHNTCNLACVMCGADRSSRIRTGRSNLPPLPHAYGEPFFEQIVPFLEHAGAVDFSGGEPFLVTEHMRIWDLLLAMDRRPVCSLTTNGTVWNARTERVLGGLDTHIAVSVDGMTAATFESIRVGARFDEVMGNLERYLDYTRARGTSLSMSWSLVRDNWSELGAAALFAEERGIHLKVQTVIEPEFGVQRLPTDELTAVVRALEAEAERIEGSLELNLATWQREVARLRTELERRASTTRRVLSAEPADPANVERVVEAMVDTGARRVPDGELEAILERSAADVRAWCSTDDVIRLELDPSGRITAAPLEARLPGTRATVGSIGAGTVADLLYAYEQLLDGMVWIIDEWPEPDRLVHSLAIGRAIRDKVALMLKVVTVATDAGVSLVLGADATLLPADPTVVPVSLGTTRRPAALRA
jgi:MoaA/NifB/PqqE/SkfB family radical SAM enzyme